MGFDLQIDAYNPLVEQLNLDGERRERVWKILLELLSEASLLKGHLTVCHVEEIVALFEAAKEGLGSAAICTSSFLTRVITDSSLDKVAAKEVLENFSLQSFFPIELKERLAVFRADFKSSFEAQYETIINDPVQLRSFQTAVCADLRKKIIDPLFAFPLKIILSQKKVFLEVIAYGSLGRRNGLHFPT